MMTFPCAILATLMAVTSVVASAASINLTRSPVATFQSWTLSACATATRLDPLTP